MKLFRYIVPILFLFCSVAGKGQWNDSVKIEIDSSLYRKANIAIEEDNCESCKCFWLVFDKITLESVTCLRDPLARFEAVPKIKEFIHDDKQFLRVESQIPTAIIWTSPGSLTFSIDEQHFSMNFRWNDSEIYKEKISKFHPDTITIPSDAILIIPSSELPYHNVIKVTLEPCESFETFLRKFQNGGYLPYGQPFFPEKLNNYEADGFKSLKEW